jgi:hypothetical protein
MSPLVSPPWGNKSQKTAISTKQINLSPHIVEGVKKQEVLMEEDKEVQSVRRAASKAWHAIERKHRRALETAIQTRERMEELENVIRGLDPRGKRAA